MESPRLLEERIRRFERLGGVPLADLSPDQHRLVQIGLEPLKRARFSFVCPLCRNRHASDVEMEPMCTGPNWTDDHEPTVMVRENG